MATTPTTGPGSYSLGTGQTGNVDTTNTIDRRGTRGPCAVAVTTTVGATPTVKVDILGSVDGVNWYNVTYSLTATPRTQTEAQITITTAATFTYLLAVDQPWRFLKLTYSSNTNVTLSATAYF